MKFGQNLVRTTRLTFLNKKVEIFLSDYLSRITTRFVDNGNTIVGSKTEIYSFAGGNATTVDGKLFTYDTSPNPYKGLLGFNEWYYSSPDFSTDSDVTSLRGCLRLCFTDFSGH